MQQDGSRDPSHEGAEELSCLGLSEIGLGFRV